MTFAAFAPTNDEDGLPAAMHKFVKRLAGVTLSENQAMLHLARKFGFRTGRVPGDATVMEVSLDLR